MATPRNDEPHHCDALLERFSEYLDRELDEQSARELEHHLDACRECSLKMSEFRRLLDCYHAFRGAVSGPCMSEDCRRRLRLRVLGD